MINKAKLRQRFTDRVNQARIKRDWSWEDIKRKTMMSETQRRLLCNNRLDPTRDLAVSFALIFGESQDEWLWALGFTPTWWMEFGIEQPERMTSVMSAELYKFVSMP